MDTPVPTQSSLGPHVVGMRIVVRRVLPGETGPSGGPALTDLLGICLAWTEDACVVQPESGPAVTIALADIVSGKPVPPRPSARMRVSARDAELHTATLWPSVEVEQLGEWQLRVDTAPAGRRRKRANSCLAMGEPGVPVLDALARVRAFYPARGLPALLQVEAGSDEEAQVRAAGWKDIEGESDLLLASVSRLRRTLPRQLPRQLPRVELEVTARYSAATLGTSTDLLARGRAALDGDWVGLHDLEVVPPSRRRGLASAIVATLLEWAAEQGAMTAWLHVETDNPAARAFWEALGFSPHHTCRYYAPSSASASPVSR